MLSRRSLFEKSIKVSAGMVLAPALRSLAAPPATLAISLDKSQAVRIPANFIGFGYEMSSVATHGLLSASNDRYVRLAGTLGRQGVLRVGGIVADHTRYEPFGQAVAEPKNTVITRAELEQFNGFLAKIGWTAIWSVNFAQGTLDDAVKEAREVASVLGPRLLALEIGNEVENYSRGDKPFRKTPYSYDSYRAEYTEWRAAILKAVPGVHFAAPDTAAAVEWVERMARDANGDVQLLTTHYYRGGQKQGSAEQLLAPDPRLKSILERLRAASKASGIPWRMCETNSFFGGGLPGVSDTFVGALWTLDFMLLLVVRCSVLRHAGVCDSHAGLHGGDAGRRSRIRARPHGLFAWFRRQGSICCVDQSRRVRYDSFGGRPGASSLWGDAPARAVRQQHNGGYICRRFG